MSDNGAETKEVATAQQQSIQSRARERGVSGGISLLTFLVRGGALVSPWWSKQRDLDLYRFAMSSNHLMGAYYTLSSKLASVPFQVVPRDSSVKAHRNQAEEYQARLEEESELGQGWQEIWVLGLYDLWTMDNGMFLEVTGDGQPDGPIVGPATGLLHLDSWRCTRTGDAEFPVVYQDEDGGRYKLHRTRVIYRSQMPSPRAEMYRVGYCWTSRAIDAAQNLVDIATYKQEKLGSRPLRSIGVCKGGLDPETVQTAFDLSQMAMSSQGLSRFSKMVLVGDENMPDADIDFKDLASLPDGFDEEKSTSLAMYTIALTGAVPPRWLWPATVVGATKADAMYQHVAGLTGGPGATLQMIATALGGSERGKTHTTGKFLPPSLKLVFDFQDDEQDRMAAEIQDTRSQARERDVDSGVVTVRVAREQMLDDGEISDAQFEEMELDEGRLPDGADILTLFHSHDGQMQGLLAVDAEGEPLKVEANDGALWLAAIDKQIRLVEAIMTNAPNAGLKRKARQAAAALEKLRGLYGGGEGQEPPEEPAKEEEVEVEEEVSPFEEKTMANFSYSLRAEARKLWRDETDIFSFVDGMNATVFRGYEQAWREGAAMCGILPGDRTQDEQIVLDGYITNAQARITSLAQFIMGHSKLAGGKWRDVTNRLEVWYQRYNEIRERAKGMACADAKAIWEYGDTIEHCADCSRVVGRVYRLSVWDKYGWIPGSRALACGGWRCDCRRAPTDAPVTPGRPPALIGPK